MNIFLFGKFSLEITPGVSAPVRLEPKVKELLAALIIASSQTSPRSQLACQLWPQRADHEARRLLSKALGKLEETFDEARQCLAGACVPIILFAGDEVGWAPPPEAQIWADVLAFQRACCQAQEFSSSESGIQGIGLLKDAVQLYRGPFLEGCYSPWRQEAAQQFEAAYFSAAEQLMDLYEAQADYDQALEVGLQALRLEHSRENLFLRVMRLLYLSGDRTSALRQFQRLAVILQADLQVQPGPETVKVYQQIEAGADKGHLFGIYADRNIHVGRQPSSNSGALYRP